MTKNIRKNNLHRIQIRLTQNNFDKTKKAKKLLRQQGYKASISKIINNTLDSKNRPVNQSSKINSLSKSRYEQIQNKIAKLSELIGNLDNNINQIARALNTSLYKGKVNQSALANLASLTKLVNDSENKVTKLWLQL